MEITYSVYRLTCIVNGKMYFGITKRPINIRMKQHRKYAKNGSQFLISRAIRSHGWDSFAVDVLATGLSMQEACDMEVGLISKHKTCYENGYNMAAGGQSGISLRPETKERRSISGKKGWETNPKVRAVVTNPERNRKIGEHTKLMFKDPEYRKYFDLRHASMVEKSKDPECRQRAIKTYMENGHSTKVACSNGMTFDSIALAAEWVSSQIGGDGKSKRSGICAAVRGRRITSFGYRWTAINDA